MSLLTPIELQKIFEKMDINGDGFVSIEELNWLLQNIGFNFSLEEVESIMEKKNLDMSEFLFFYNSISKQNNGDDESRSNGGDENNIHDLVETFKVFDMNGDGFISSQELECVLKRLGLWNGKDCRSMICFYDTNFDGQLDFEEFKNMMLLNIS
ncbi:hypothetical protein Lal_00004456 [Lupinus albus]|uniref:Putative EF-hand domain pair protein n=1 Tax=Lupinus albus TaxID=3870 RepID=A0A6A4NKN6_LUPAL|nr:putative EF-hand domain pair protein [Lupinus albus]KAF1865082.1 hypothetical protein Lal_00004456 [Lupinus albus]